MTAVPGVRSPNITSRPSVSDDIVVNRDRTTGLQSVENLARQLAGTSPIRYLNGVAPIFDTVAELLAADIDNPVSAWVIGDPDIDNIGIWGWSGADWAWALPLPYDRIIALDEAGGTANAIQATTKIPVFDMAMIQMEVAEANGPGPVTVQFNGGGPIYTIKTNSNNDPAAGGLPGGMIVLGVLSGSTLRLISDQASTAILAASEAAKTLAEAARAGAEAARDIAIAGVTVPIYSTIDGMSAVTVPVLIKTVRVNGRATAGDGKEGTFIRVTADPGSTVSADDKFRSADRFMPDGSTNSGNGGWWLRKAATYAEAKSNQWIPGRKFGLPAGYGAGTAAAFNMAMQAVALRVVARLSFLQRICCPTLSSTINTPRC